MLPIIVFAVLLICPLVDLNPAIAGRDGVPSRRVGGGSRFEERQEQDRRLQAQIGPENRVFGRGDTRVHVLRGA